MTGRWTGAAGPDFRALLETLDPKARDVLRSVLIHDQADRDAVASQLLRYRDGRGDDWGRHHRLPDDVSGCSALCCEGARGDGSSMTIDSQVTELAAGQVLMATR